jgi:hypothetical protein
MKKTLTAIALVLGLGAAGAAHAQQMISNDSTGWQLYSFCQTDVAMCGSYLAGVWNGFNEARRLQSTVHPELARLNQTMMCPPAEVSMVTLRKVFLGYAETHTTGLTYSSGDEAILAFATAFPCSRS